MYTTVLWDVDGTLLNFDKSESYAIKKALSDFGINGITDETVRRYSEINLSYWERLELGQISREEVCIGRFREFFALYKLPEIDFYAFNKHYQTLLGSVYFINDNSLELCRRLCGRVRQYIVTNGNAYVQSRKLALSGFDKLMDGIFISEQIGFEKPSTEYFESVFKSIGICDLSDIIIIGDSLTSDVKGGVNSRIKTCWYNPKGLENNTDIRPDFEIADLSEAENIIFGKTPQFVPQK